MGGEWVGEMRGWVKWVEVGRRDEGWMKWVRMGRRDEGMGEVGGKWGEEMRGG